MTTYTSSCDADGNETMDCSLGFKELHRINLRYGEGNVGNPYISDPICRHIHSVSEYQGEFFL